VPPPDGPTPIAYGSYLNLPAFSSVSIARTGRQLVVSSDADPRIHLYLIEIESHAGLSWNIWMGPVGTGRAVMLPDPSAPGIGLTDPMADATADDGTIGGPTARLLGVRLRRRVTDEQLGKFGTLTLDQLGTNVAAFTVLQVPVGQ
jgi:hypothetical protein